VKQDDWVMTVNNFNHFVR